METRYLEGKSYEETLRAIRNIRAGGGYDRWLITGKDKDDLVFELEIQRTPIKGSRRNEYNYTMVITFMYKGLLRKVYRKGRYFSSLIKDNIDVILVRLRQAYKKRVY